MTDAAAHLRKRHAAERRFRLYGRIAIVIALSFLALLLGRVAMQGYTTFLTHSINLSVHLDAARIDAGYPQGSNFDALVADAVLKEVGAPPDASIDAQELVSRDLGFQLMDMVRNDPSRIGQTVRVTGPVRADADLYYKGQIKRATPQG